MIENGLLKAPSMSSLHIICCNTLDRSKLKLRCRHPGIYLVAPCYKALNAISTVFKHVTRLLINTKPGVGFRPDSYRDRRLSCLLPGI